MLLKFEVVCLLVSHLSVDVRIRLIKIVDATVLYVVSGISTGYDIVVTGFAGEQYLCTSPGEVDFNSHPETEILT